jgi:hypothetical protein
MISRACKKKYMYYICTDSFKYVNYSPALGRAAAQRLDAGFPPAAARVRVRAACGVCGRQSGTGAGFLRVL